MSGQQQDGRLHASQTREYLYDGAGNLAGARHNREAAGYKLDATGRVLSVLSGGVGRTVETDEAYRYTRNGLPQETARLTEWQAGRLTQHDDTHYQYDKAGRLIRKQVVQPGYRPQVWHYRWDSRNQLRVVDTPTGERWFYRYDPFGRRTGKRCEQTSEDIRYLWDGDQIAEVRHYRNGERVARRHWVHNGWELLVQQRQNTDGRWETDFVTSSQNGEPQALYRPDGTLRWQAPKSTLWGQRQGSTEDPADPGLGFAGQYRDTESGLCYNRFRYYDPAGGCYVSPDPIGIAGGDNNYAYAPNPISWIDPLGLAKCPLPSKVNLTRDGVQHVKDRHVGNKIGWDHKSKWTIGNAEWKSTVRNVFRNPDRITRDGSRFVYEKTLPRTVGRTPEGEALTKVRVVVESNGDLVTAFPQSVFRDVKTIDLIL
ncbi:RHS repeat-associated core domain-containing protein, partial [Pectobacterium odoriferum]